MNFELKYNFGDEVFCYTPTYKEIEDFLIPIISFGKKYSKDEVKKILEDDVVFEEFFKLYKQELTTYMKDDAEKEFEFANDNYFDDQESEECRGGNFL